MKTAKQSAQLAVIPVQAIWCGVEAVEEDVKTSWFALLGYRQTWAFAFGKFMTDGVWWFFLFWLPSYLEKERGTNPLKSSMLVAIIYAGASVGSILGGWFSGFLMRKGWPVGKARMTTMLVPALFMPASIFAYYVAALFMPSIYESLAHLAGMVYMPDIVKDNRVVLMDDIYGLIK